MLEEAVACFIKPGEQQGGLAQEAAEFKAWTAKLAEQARAQEAHVEKEAADAAATLQAAAEPPPQLVTENSAAGDINAAKRKAVFEKLLNKRQELLQEMGLDKGDVEMLEESLEREAKKARPVGSSG